MKNTHIASLKEVVPAKIRIEVYKESLIIFKNISKFDRLDGGLCILLPMVLWGLKSFLDTAPNGEDWKWKDTVIAFPEIAPLLPKIWKADGKDKTTCRIEGLEEIIKNWNS